MDKELLWNKFEATGRIEDYLKYVKEEVVDETDKGEGSSNKGNTIQ